MESHAKELILVDHEDELIVDKDTYNGLLDTAGKVDAILTELSLARRVVEAAEKYGLQHQKCCGWEINVHGSPVYFDRCTCGADAALSAYREGVGDV